MRRKSYIREAQLGESRRRRSMGMRMWRVNKIWHVELDALTVPDWAKEKAVKGLTLTDKTVWLKPSDARYLVSRDRQMGGDPVFTKVEYRICSICKRILLDMDAQERRMLDIMDMGKMVPCGGNCLAMERARKGIVLEC